MTITQYIEAKKIYGGLLELQTITSQDQSVIDEVNDKIGDESQNYWNTTGYEPEEDGRKPPTSPPIPPPGL